MANIACIVVWPQMHFLDLRQLDHWLNGWMDTILQCIPQVICYIDDILVTGKDDAEHLKNLAAVLQRLQQHLKLPEY